MLKNLLGTLSVFIQNLKIKIKKLLRSSEQYTKTDMVYLVRGSFWSLVQQGTGSMSSFVVVLILTNILAKDTFGQYRFILSIIPILTLFTLPDMGMSLLRSVARGNKINLPKIVEAKVQWGLLGSLAALLLSAYYFYAGNLLLFYALVITSVFLPFIEAFPIYLAYYKGKQDFRTPAIYDSISRIFQAVVLIVSALIFKDVIFILIAFFAGQLIARFFFYKKTLKNILQLEEAQGHSLDADDNLISYGKNLSILGIVSTIRDNLDKLLVWHFLGAEALAVYYVALTIPNNLVLLFNVIPRIAFPKFSKSSWGVDEHTKVIRKIFILFFALILPALIYVLLVPFAIPIIFKTYHASILPALIFASLIFISPVNAMIGQVFYAQKSIKKMLVIQVLGIIIFSSVFLITYKSLGVAGGALALVLSVISNFIVGIMFMKYKLFMVD